MKGSNLFYCLSLLLGSATALTPRVGSQQILSTLPENKWLSPEFDKLVEKLMKDYKVPGLSIAVIDGDETYAKGYGIASGIGGNEEIVTPETLFYTGSTTKAFTAAAMSLLVDDNDKYPHVQWTTPISELIRDDFVLSDSRWTPIITIEDALSHRTGMDGHDFTYGANISTVRDVVRNLRNLPFTYQPRTNYIYCNYMFVTVSHVIETLTGSWLGDFLKENIWEPIGMGSTFFSLEDAQSSSDSLARGYYWNNETQSYVPLDWMVMPHISGAGTIISSVLDYAKWIRVMMNQDKPLSKAGHNAVTSPHFIFPMDTAGTPILNPTYALGWGNIVCRNATVITHNGGLIGFGTNVAFLPQFKKGVVLMANTRETSNEIQTVLTNFLIEEFLGIPAEEKYDWETRQWQRHLELLAAQDEKTAREKLFPNETTSLYPATLPIKGYAGSYHNAGYQTIDLEVRGENLWASMSDRTWAMNLTLSHVTGDHFFVAGTNDLQQDMAIFTKAEFHVDASGVSNSVEFIFPDREKPEATWFDRL